MSAWDQAKRPADVVILTTIRLEFDAVLAVEAGAVPGSAWDVVASPNGLPVAFRSFAAPHGRPLRVATSVAADMGATAALHALLPLVEALQPRCVAMCGVCAGRRDKAHLGDVIAADRLYFHDTGKQLSDRVLQDATTYKLRDDWKAALDGLDAAAQFGDAAWLQRRPLTTEWREHRALIALRDRVPEPWNAVEPELGADAWKRIVEVLRARKLLASSGSALTGKGRRVADDLLFAHRGALPDLSPTGAYQPFRLHVAPMGSGSRVIEDETIWGSVSLAMRKTLGLDMEAAVLGELAHRHRQRPLDVVVMKGVMDFADHGRDDHFKEFAARASAECLLWFLRERVGVEPQVRLPGSRVDHGVERAPRAPGARFDYTIERQRHDGFVGREGVLAELDRLLVDDTADRWVAVTGGPGMGKSAILAAWLERREAAGAFVPHHFIRHGLYEWDDPDKLVGSLVAQIAARFPDHSESEEDTRMTAAARLLAMLGRVSRHELGPRRERLVVLIDGLDEYDPPAGTATGDPLAAFLPHALPRGVSFLCASRPRHPYLPMLLARDGGHASINLDDEVHAADNEATVRRFWAREAPPLGLGPTFVDEAVACAVGNLQHAVTLQKHLRGLSSDQRRVETLPKGLDALLEKVWRRVVADPTAVHGLGILCAAREALTLDELGRVAGWAAVDQRDRFVHAAREFLVETRREDRQAEYRLHHASLREHITAKIGPTMIRGHHAALADTLATWPAPSDATGRRYALRHALGHRCEASDWPAVSALACNVGFLEAKCRELGAHEVEADVAHAAARCGVEREETVARELDDLAHAVTRESHWLRGEPGVLAVQLWNRLRRMGWSPDDLDRRLRMPKTAAPFLRVRHAASRESPALLRDLVGHSSVVTACAILPDGRRVVSASGDNTLKVWDLETGRVVTTLEGHTGRVMSCAVLPDGRRVISASYDRTLKVWDLDTGRVITTLEGHSDWVRSCAVTPDGACVVSASQDRTLKVWDLEAGCVLTTLEGHAGGVYSCSVTPDGRRLVSASGDRTLKVWNLATSNVVGTLEGHSDLVRSCTVTPDGRRVVSASHDRTLKVWDLDTGRVLATLEGHSDGVLNCAVTSDGRRVVSASYDRTLKVWDLDTGRVRTTLEGHSDGVYSCGVTPDGRRVVSASYDRTLKVWGLDTGRVPTTLEGHTLWIRHCAVTPDGRRVVSASDDNTLKVWDLDTGRVVTTLEGHDGAVSSCAITPDGRRVVSASYDQTLKVWDLDTGRVVTTLEGHTGAVWSCAVTPDGRRVVSASGDRTLKVWDLDTGRVITTLEGHTDWVMSCSIAPDGGRVVSASDDETLKVWDLDTGRAATTLGGHSGPVWSCAVTPDGRRVVSASYDQTLKIWSLDTGRVLTVLEGHTDAVMSCSVTPDGRRVVSASRDNTLKIWDLATSTCLVTHRGDTAFTAVVATASAVYVGDAAGTLWFLGAPDFLMSGPDPALLSATSSPAPRRW